VLTELIGKEGNRLTERLTGEIADQAEYLTSYGRRIDGWGYLVLPTLRWLGVPVVIRRSGLHRRTIERALRIADPTRPHPGHRALLLEIALEGARAHLRGAGSEPPYDPHSCLYRFLSLMPLTNRTCACGCGLALRSRQVKWYSDAHRKRASRRDI
jgi:hypothetical protein